MPGFFIHGHEKAATEGTCDRCERNLVGRQAFDVSYDGYIAKYRVCGSCFSHIAQSFGVRKAEGGQGRPKVEKEGRE